MVTLGSSNSIRRLTHRKRADRKRVKKGEIHVMSGFCQSSKFQSDDADDYTVAQCPRCRSLCFNQSCFNQHIRIWARILGQKSTLHVASWVPGKRSVSSLRKDRPRGLTQTRSLRRGPLPHQSIVIHVIKERKQKQKKSQPDNRDQQHACFGSPDPFPTYWCRM